RSEEEKFKSVVENATAQLEEIFARAEEKGRHHLEGSEIFKLYDTFGLPVDFVQEMANERKFELDLEGFEEEMSHQRKTARAAWKGDLTFEAQQIYRNLSQSYQGTFTGYWSVEEKDCEIVQILNQFRPVLKISA